MSIAALILVWISAAITVAGIFHRIRQSQPPTPKPPLSVVKSIHQKNGDAFIEGLKKGLGDDAS